VLGEELKGIFVDVGPSLESGFKTAREDIDAWIKSLKGELAELNAWWEGHGDKAKPNPNPKILGPGDEGYNPIRGSASDIRGMGGETPGAEIRQEAVITRATMRGTAEGSRIGVLNASGNGKTRSAAAPASKRRHIILAKVLAPVATLVAATAA
jgi:hypothetical protein